MIRCNNATRKAGIEPDNDADRLYYQTSPANAILQHVDNIQHVKKVLNQVFNEKAGG